MNPKFKEFEWYCFFDQREIKRIFLCLKKRRRAPEPKIPEYEEESGNDTVSYSEKEEDDDNDEVLSDNS